MFFSLFLTRRRNVAHWWNAADERVTESTGGMQQSEEFGGIWPTGGMQRQCAPAWPRRWCGGGGGPVVVVTIQAEPLVAPVAVAMVPEGLFNLKGPGRGDHDVTFSSYRVGSN